MTTVSRINGVPYHEQPDIKSNPNPITTQHAVVSM